MNKEEFLEEVKKLGIEIKEEQLNQLEKFYEILIEENQKINLTRITDKEEVYLKHFYDSLTLIKAVDLDKVETLCDVGTGAGFTGVVLKIVFPHLKITLIDSLLKRVNYLNETIKKLNLKDIKAIHTRSEDYQGKFDVVTSRAVANLKKLLGYTIHLIKTDGKFIAMKANVDEELNNISKDLNKYKCKITNKIEFKLPKEESNRTLVVLERV